MTLYYYMLIVRRRIYSYADVETYAYYNLKQCDAAYRCLHITECWYQRIHFEIILSSQREGHSKMMKPELKICASVVHCIYVLALFIAVGYVFFSYT